LSLIEIESVTALGNAIQHRQARIIGPIRQETLSGIQDPIAFSKTQSPLATFPDELLISVDFEEAARRFNLFRSSGLAAGPIDILIGAVALRRKWQVLTLDNGLKRCLAMVR
jgi:predicted nucleic acid-binding protein